MKGAGVKNIHTYPWTVHISGSFRMLEDSSSIFLSLRSIGEHRSKNIHATSYRRRKKTCNLPFSSDYSDRWTVWFILPPLLWCFIPPPPKMQKLLQLLPYFANKAFIYSPPIDRSERNMLLLSSMILKDASCGILELRCFYCISIQIVKKNNRLIRGATKKGITTL